MTRVVKTSSARQTKASPVRRVSKEEDKRFADYSSLKASTGIVLPEVKRVLLDRKRAEESVVHRTRIMYPSEMARNDWCPRATFYRMSGRKEPSSKTSFTMENVFAEGNTVHSKWQNWLSDTGKLWGDWRCSRCSEYIKNSLKPAPTDFGACVGTGWTRINGATLAEDLTYEHEWRYKEVTLRGQSLPISGHADGALINHNCLIELKTLGVGSLKYEAPKLVETHTYDVGGKKIIDIDGIWKDFHRPLSAHINQGDLYLWMCREMGLPFDKISFVYEFKANQRSKEFVVPFSQDVVNPILDVARIVVSALERQTPPECPFGGCAQCKGYENVEP